MILKDYYKLDPTALDVGKVFYFENGSGFKEERLIVKSTRTDIYYTVKDNPRPYRLYKDQLLDRDFYFVRVEIEGLEL